MASPQQAALAVTCAVGDQAILLLNDAYHMLVNARILAAPPPSDRWFDLMKELEHVPDGGTTTSAADRLGESVLNKAAMFLMVEAGDIEEQACFLAPDDADADRLEAITAKVNKMADALLDHIDHRTWRSAGARLHATANEARRAAHSRLDQTDPHARGVLDMSGSARPPRRWWWRFLDDAWRRIAEERRGLWRDIPGGGPRGQLLTVAGAQERVAALTDAIALDEAGGSRRHCAVGRMARGGVFVLVAVIDFPITLWLISSLFNVGWAAPSGLPLIVGIVVSLLVTAGSAAALFHIGYSLREYKSDARGLLWIRLPVGAVLRLAAVALLAALLVVVVIVRVYTEGGLSGLDGYAGQLAALVALVRLTSAGLVFWTGFRDGSPERDDLAFYADVVNEHVRRLGYNRAVELADRYAFAGAASSAAPQEAARRSNPTRIRSAPVRRPASARGLVAAAAIFAVLLSGGLLYLGFAAGSPAASSNAATVILVSGSATEPRPALSPRVAVTLRDAATAGSKSVVITSADGAVVDSLSLTPGPPAVSGNGVQNRSANDPFLQVLGRVDSAMQSVSARQTELDLLAGLSAAVRNRAPGDLIVVSNGLSTAGGLDLRLVGWDADPSDVAARLLEQDLLPALAGWRVVFSGLGNTAGTQPPLSEPARAALIGYWAAACQAAGAVSCQIDNSGPADITIHSSAMAAVIPVPGVSLLNDPGGSTLVTVSDGVLFAPNSAELSSGAPSVLREIADRIGRDIVDRPADPVRVTGTTAGDGSSPFSQQLALVRAQAVAEALAGAGVTQPIEVEVGSRGDPASAAAAGGVVISF